MTNEQVIEQLRNDAIPIAKKMFNDACSECVIDQAIEVAVSSLKQVSPEYRQKFIALMNVTFNESGEERE